MTTETPQPMNKRTAHLLLTTASGHLDTIGREAALLTEAADAIQRVQGHRDALPELGDTPQLGKRSTSSPSYATPRSSAVSELRPQPKHSTAWPP